MFHVSAPVWLSTRLHVDAKLKGDTIPVHWKGLLRVLRDAFSHPPSFKMPSMSTLRPPLGPIDGNHTRRKELTPKMLNKVCALAEDGYNVLYIMARYKLLRKAIRYCQLRRLGARGGAGKPTLLSLKN
jgi:hypothetical protein